MGLWAEDLAAWNLTVRERRSELRITAYCDGPRGLAKLVGRTEESHWPFATKIFSGLCSSSTDATGISLRRLGSDVGVSPCEELRKK